VQFFEQPRHVLAESLHDANAFFVLLDIADFQLGDGEDLRLERPPFLLAVDFDAGVVGSTLSVAKQVRDVCSFPLPLYFALLHGKSVEKRCRS